MFISHFCVCVCVFLFFHISVDCRVPLADACARLASFWIDCGTIVGLTFPPFPPPAPNSCRDFARNFSRNLQRTCRELSRKLQKMQRTCRELATNLCKELSHKRNLKRRIPFFDATSVKNVKNSQTRPRTFRNLDLEIALLQFAVLQNASSCNKRMHRNPELQKWGAAVLAPHGAFGSAAPCSQGTGRLKFIANSDEFLSICKLRKLFGDPTSAADPCCRKHLFTPPPLFFCSFLFFSRSKNRRKSDLYQISP